MQFKVPQNIDMQDRILGPLTMVQFIYAVVGGGVCYAIFNAVGKPFSYLLITPIVLFVLALIFLKINERPFWNFLVSAFEYSLAPKKRFWHHSDFSSNFEIEIKSVNNKPVTLPTKNISHDQIRNVAERLDTNQSNYGK